MIEPFDLQLWPPFAQLKRKKGVIDQIAADSRRIATQKALFIALTGQKDGHDFIPHAAQMGAAYAIVKESYVPPSNLALPLIRVPSPLRALQQIANLYRLQRKAKIIAITGSFGKTTLKDLLAIILRQRYSVAISPESFNSQLGVALSLLQIKDSDDLALIEAGISKPNEMNYLSQMIAPDYAILTNVGQQHSETLGSLEQIAQEKAQLLAAVPLDGWVIAPSPLPSPIKATSYWQQTQGCDYLPYLLNEGNRLTLIFPSGNKKTFVPKKPAFYLPQLLNIALKAGYLLKIEEEILTTTLASYQQEPMSKEIWQALSTLWINEPYSSDLMSIELALKQLALEPLKGKRAFLFSGLRHLNPLLELNGLAATLSQAPVDDLFLIDQPPALYQALKKCNPPFSLHQSPSLEHVASKMRDLPQIKTILIKGAAKAPLDAIIEHFGASISANFCLLNLSRVQYNIEQLKSKLGPKTRLMVMVKALAYGTDKERMAHFLAAQGIDLLGVATIDEGIELCLSQASQEIFVFHTAIYEISKAVRYNLTLGVSSLEVIEKIAQAAAPLQKKIKLHLHVDTGMGRVGCRPEEALSLAQAIDSSPHLQLDGLFSHFAAADDPIHDPFSQQQIHLFEQTLAQLEAHNLRPQWRHLFNSSAALRFSSNSCNLARIGLAIWGVMADKQVANSLSLKPAVTLRTKVCGINLMHPKESVGYGRRYQVTGQQKIATLPLGYFDGLHRSYSSKGYALIRGQRAPFVGNICMDYMMCDVTHIPEVQEGDNALLFGENEEGDFIPLETFAQNVGSIPHQLMTCLGPRIQRIFVYDDSQIPPSA